MPASKMHREDLICFLTGLVLSRVSHPTQHKIGHFGDVLPSQSLGLVLKNITRWLNVTGFQVVRFLCCLLFVS